MRLRKGVFRRKGSQWPLVPGLGVHGSWEPGCRSLEKPRPSEGHGPGGGWGGRRGVKENSDSHHPQGVAAGQAVSLLL